MFADVEVEWAEHVRGRGRRLMVLIADADRRGLGEVDRAELGSLLAIWPDLISTVEPECRRGTV